jgi:hypothetical protein
MEKTERTESESANITVMKKYSQHASTIAVEQPPSGKMVIDVYGQQIEPICSYRLLIYLGL